MKIKLTICIAFVILINLSGCANFKPQYETKNDVEFINEKKVSHSFYLIGDAGNSANESGALDLLRKQLDKANNNSTVIFLGDNIYPKGLPKKNDKGRVDAVNQLNAQTNVVSNFSGETIFIPGNHDWYNGGITGLKRQEEFIEKKIGKNSFLPENGCPIEKVDISKDIVLIIIDSEWYLTNWDKHPGINSNCEIKTRESFFDEYESLIKKARGKTTIVALHHPIFTNGPHGGQYSFKSHLEPLPIIGTIKNILRRTGGVTTVDQQNKRYNDLRNRIITLSQENEKTIFVSGHEHSLQYIVEDNLPQIVSGSGSKSSATRTVGTGLFSYGSVGIARLDINEDGSSVVAFYSSVGNKKVFQTEIFSANKKATVNYPSNFSKFQRSAIYAEKEIKKSNFYTSIWGERYRTYYGVKVEAPIVNLDTLFGGLLPVRKGGGHQSKSLRLKDSRGSEYVMRALRKNAVQYLQAVAFKNQYVKDEFRDTYTEGLLLDVFTGSHPYAPFTIGTLADKIGVFHTNPVLYYVPKQNALGYYNDDFGDELYMIEERASDGHGNQKSFGYSDKLISTTDLLKELHKDEDVVLDEAAYIRARLFDMLIGDWDRHEDQWRWAKFKEQSKTVYRPVPRDRDQAFSIMADGALLGVVTKILPSLRLMQSYGEELKSPKWFNLEPYPLDMALINESVKTVWDKQVQLITTNISEEVIDEAFTFFPKEVSDESIKEIKRKLIGRLQNLQTISDQYFLEINKYGVVKGTNKDDFFEIKRHQNKTTVTAYRIKKGVKSDVFFKKTYSKLTTKEIWIYGLDDDDCFEVTGQGTDFIKVRLVGGQNKDTYNVQNGKKVVVYDFKTKENEFVTKRGLRKLTDNYETNVYDYKKLKYNSNLLIPSFGSNPDDGFKIGLININTKNHFERNPFSAQHKFSAFYYFATNGFDMSYTGEFANIIGQTNLHINSKFTSPNYAVNFFGFGNETPNLEIDNNEISLDYNRVKLRTILINPSIQWRGHLGSSVRFGVSYESIKIEKSLNRFIDSVVDDTKSLTNDFLGALIAYSYKNRDDNAFPTLGLETTIELGYKSNIKTSKSFSYLKPSVVLDHKISSNGQLVLASKFLGHLNFGDNFEFYQAATIGANSGLRGYRNERFTGNNSFVQSTDFRINIRKLKTSLLPLDIGLYGGFDYGRVWLDEENSRKWHQSFGGGVFFNGADMIVGNLSAFFSEEGARLAFKIGFGF